MITVIKIIKINNFVLKHSYHKSDFITSFYFEIVLRLNTDLKS